MKNLLKPGWIVLALALTILLTLKHNFAVYQDVVSYRFFEDDNLSAWYTAFMMLSFDFGIFMLAVRGNRAASLIFSLITFVINTYFYYAQLEAHQGWEALIPGLGFSIMASYLIFYFSDEFAYEIRKAKEEKDLVRENEVLKKQCASYAQLIKQYNKAGLEMAKKPRKPKKKKLEPYVNLTDRYISKSRKQILDGLSYRRRKLEQNGMTQDAKEKIKAEIQDLEMMLG